MVSVPSRSAHPRAHGLSQLAVRYDYRADGWPLCPRCGEDELMSTIPLHQANPHLSGPISLVAATPLDPMRCLACNWSGTVPAQHETD
jgi:hypothetical protein